MIGLTPGNLITHLRGLGEAKCVSSEKTRAWTVAVSTVTLNADGRKALGARAQGLCDPRIDA